MAWRSKMHVIIALAVLALSLWLGGCARRDQAAYAKPVAFREFPKPTEVIEVKPESSPGPNASVRPPISAETKLAAAAMAQEAPKDIVASQIRSQGYACDSPQSAERDMAASKAHEVAWILDCQNASYRVILVPSMSAKVDKVRDAPANSPSLPL
jgi:hypothetical protein